MPDWKGLAAGLFGKRIAGEATQDVIQARNFAVTGRDRDFADAMRINRRPRDLMMLPVDWKPERMPARAMVDVKWDGIHLGYRRDVGAFTREGVDFRAASHLLRGLQDVDEALGGDYVLFGEYVHIHGFEATVADFRRGEGTGAVMLFDAVPLDAWQGRAPSRPLIERRAWLGHAHAQVGRGLVMLTKAQVFEGTTRDNIELTAGEMWRLGHEGIVVKDGDSPYVRGPSPFWQRIKRVDTIDGRIVGLTMRDRGGLKSIDVELPDRTRVTVGTGFSTAERQEPCRFFIPGRIVELNHLGRHPSGALRSPSFNRLRPDKES